MVGVLRSREVGVITCIECAALVTHHIAAVDANIMACVDVDAVSTEVAATFACATVSAVEPFYLQVGAVVGLHNFLVLAFMFVGLRFTQPQPTSGGAARAFVHKSHRRTIAFTA